LRVIDDRIQEPWPDDVFDALRRFRLGHLIEDPPLSFEGFAAIPLWSPGNGDRPADNGPVEVPGCPYAIITTQTCNIAERPPKGAWPWIQVSPVYRLADEEAIGDRIYLHRLTAATLPAGVWVADLRLEVPLEKSHLVGRDPIDGFANEDDEIVFGEMLGRQRDRAALHDVVNDVLYGRWRKKRANNKSRARRLFENLHMVGMLIQQGTRLEPIAVELHFVGAGKPISEEDREWLEAWWDKASEEAQDSTPALNLFPNVYHDGSAMDITVYDDLIPLEAWLES
jgi:hypothetical protein